jgi:hypothetical protein
MASTPGAARAGAARLALDDGYVLLSRLAALLPGPLTIAPPCCTWHSRHESMISSALTAMEAGDTARTWAALQALADPVGMETAEAERAGVMLARLAGYDGSMRSRCSSGNGGDAIARTASDTNDRALSSPATRLDLRVPQR